MANGAFDPDAFIDRVKEQQLFKSLLTFQADARVITIRDGRDKGKSELLRQLQYTCQYEAGTAVSLVALDEHTHPHQLVQFVVGELSDFELEFEAFQQVEDQRRDGHVKTAPLVQGNVNVGSNEGTVSAVHVEHLHMGADPDMDRMREKAAAAFVDDLRELAVERPLVLMFDTYDACSAEVEKWLLRLLRKRVFDPAECAERLVVVIAGRTVPTKKLEAMLGDRYGNVVTSLEQLSLWEREHVATFLAGDEFEGEHDEADVQWLYEKLKAGWTIGRARDVMKLLQTGGI